LIHARSHPLRPQGRPTLHNQTTLDQVACID
jgi:hypothetical protein